MPEFKEKVKDLNIKKILLEVEKSPYEVNESDLREDFCCTTLMEYIFLENSPISYLTATRSYILVVSNEITLDIEYCPCCGKKFPEDLTNELIIILDQLKISYDNPNLPIEFKSGKWWKTLGL